MRTAVLVGRVWGLGLVAAFVGCQVASNRLVPGSVGIPGRSEIRAAIWPLTPFLVAAAVPSVLESQFDDLARCSPRSGFVRRTLLLGPLACLVLAGVLASPAPMRGVLLRNAILGCSLALASATAVPAVATAVALVAGAIASWVLGARPAGAPPARLAVPYWSVPGPRGDAVLAVVLVGAATWYLAGRRIRCQLKEGNLP